MSWMRWMLLPLAFALPACGSDTAQEPAPQEKTNRETICGSTANAIGSAPATAASFDIDCTIAADGSANRYDCTKLQMRYELADGTVLDLSGYPGALDLFVQTDYLPGGGRQEQMLIRLAASQMRLADGSIPEVVIEAPHTLFAVGSVKASEEGSSCRQNDSCAGISLGAGFGSSKSPYELATVAGSFDLQVTSAGREPGTRFALSSGAIPIGTAEKNGLQAVCDDGKVHYTAR